MSGKMKSSKRQAAELHFDFPVESLGKLVCKVIFSLALCRVVALLT